MSSNFNKGHNPNDDENSNFFNFDSPEDLVDFLKDIGAFDNAQEYANDDVDVSKSLSFIVNNKFLFTSINATAPTITFEVNYQGHDPIPSLDFYNAILNSELMDFQVSMITGYYIVDKNGYLNIDEENGNIQVYVEYTVASGMEFINHNTSNMNYNIMLRSFKPMPFDFTLFGEASLSENLVAYIPKDPYEAQDFCKREWIYTIDIGYIDLDKNIHTNTNASSHIFNYFIKDMENQINQEITHGGILHLNFKKYYIVDFNENHLCILVKFVPYKYYDKVNNNELEISSLTPDSITIEDEETFDVENIVNNISVLYTDLYSDKSNIITVQNITKEKEIRTNDYRNFSTYHVNTRVYSLTDKNAKYYYNKVIRDSDSISIYRNKHLITDRPYIGFMSMDLYNDILSKRDTDTPSVFDEIIDSIPSLRKHQTIDVIKKIDGLICFTLR